MRQHYIYFLFIIGLWGCGGGSEPSNDISVDIGQPSNGSSAVIPTDDNSDTAPVQDTTEQNIDHSGMLPISANRVEQHEYLLGGSSTQFNFTNEAYSLRPKAVSQRFVDDGNFTSGDHIFRTPHPNDGPLLNNNTCQGCHVKDGRGSIVEGEPMISTVIKIADASGNPIAVYGNQIQPFAEQSFNTNDFTSGLAQYNGSTNGDALFGEAKVTVTWQPVSGQFDDGTPYTLRKPIFRLNNFSFGVPRQTFGLSPRLAQSVFGSGLLEAIPEENLLALTDPTDSNNDGISGRAVMVNDIVTGSEKIGRFTYKAQAPTVLHQVAHAYHNDMGLTSRFLTEENCEQEQQACINVADNEKKTGAEVDLTDKALALVEFYNRVLAVPAARGYDRDSEQWDPEFLAGRTLFHNTGCAGCHTPRHVTGQAKGSELGEVQLISLSKPAPDLDYLSEQVIYPYTDLLLHDMGGQCQSSLETAEGLACSDGPECGLVQRCEGLADGFPQGQALASEWRTPPLWGLGLVQVVNPKATFLHDGRATTIEQAILWHGGEAGNSQRAYLSLSAQQRSQMLTFLESL